MGLFDALRSRPRPLADDEASTSGSDVPLMGGLAGAGDELAAAAAAAGADGSSGLLSAGGLDGGSGGRLYNPYEGLATAMDGRGLRGTYRLPSQPEFLFAEDAAVHRRSWSENLTYYTGAGYLAGAALGGGQGAAAALRAPAAPVAAAAGVGGGGAPVFTDSPRLRVNRLLNTAGRAGRGAGNAAGALGLLFSATESAALGLADGRAPDAVPTVGAGFLTGALFRSPRGPRTAAVAGVLGAAAAGALAAARAHINPNL